MNLLERFFFHKKGAGQDTLPRKKGDESNFPLLDEFDNFSLVSFSKGNDAYLYSAWVNVAVGILIRNIARAGFVLLRGGENVKTGPLYELFRRPNRLMSRYDLWKETAAWWYLEGEAFLWAGPEYSGGIPKELYVLDPRKLRHEGEPCLKQIDILADMKEVSVLNYLAKTA
jgi:hypothetical protein